MMAHCPESNFHQLGRTYQIQSLGANLFRCSCGCDFRWESEFIWEVLTQKNDTISCERGAIDAQKKQSMEIKGEN